MGTDIYVLYKLMRNYVTSLYSGQPLSNKYMSTQGCSNVVCRCLSAPLYCMHYVFY